MVILGRRPEGIGTLGMAVNLVVPLGVSAVTPPPQEIQDLSAEIRIPRGAGDAHSHGVPSTPGGRG